MSLESTSQTAVPVAGPLHAILRRHGATMVARGGRWTAAHFGSPTSETAVCLSTVGIADRSDRTTIELRGAPDDVDTALDTVESVAEQIGTARTGPSLAIVRCDHADTCAVALLGTDVAVEVTDRLAGIEVIGPRATELIRAVSLQLLDREVIVLDTGTDAYELLIDRDDAPQLWSCLLDAGRSVSVACVGLEALEHLAAARLI